MKNLCSEVIAALEGKTLVTAESLTGGGIGAVLTSVSGASAVYKGGIISYTNAVKNKLLEIPWEILDAHGAVSAPVAKAMAEGARKVLEADVAVSVTGLAGPSGDEYGNPVGTVFIGYSDERNTAVCRFLFEGGREDVRSQTIQAVLELVLQYNA